MSNFQVVMMQIKKEVRTEKALRIMEPMMIMKMMTLMDLLKILRIWYSSRKTKVSASNHTTSSCPNTMDNPSFHTRTWRI